MLTFTQVGDEWSIIQKRMNKLRESLLNQDYSFEWAWKVECFERCEKSGHHAHAYVHGENVPDQGTFGEAALRRGFGLETDYEAITNNPDQAPKYLWGWSGEKTWSEIHPLHLPHHLWVNGGRLVHPSRKFWRFDGTPMSKAEVFKALNAGPTTRVVRS